MRGFRVRDTRRAGSPDIQRRQPVGRWTEAVDVRHVTQVIAMQMGEEDPVHPAEADVRRRIAVAFTSERSAALAGLEQRPSDSEPSDGRATSSTLGVRWVPDNRVSGGDARVEVELQ